MYMLVKHLHVEMINVTGAKVKLTIEMIIAELNNGLTVEQIAQKYKRGQWAIRYQLRKHGYFRVVTWEKRGKK